MTNGEGHFPSGLCVAFMVVIVLSGAQARFDFFIFIFLFFYDIPLIRIQIYSLGSLLIASYYSRQCDYKIG